MRDLTKHEITQLSGGRTNTVTEVLEVTLGAAIGGFLAKSYHRSPLEIGVSAAIGAFVLYVIDLPC